MKKTVSFAHDGVVIAAMVAVFVAAPVVAYPGFAPVPASAYYDLSTFSLVFSVVANLFFVAFTCRISKG